MLAAACALVFILAGAALGQYRSRREPPKGPRAIAILEFDAKGKARLVPVSILMEGRWYDAGLYRATPVPMALDQGIVYEATKDGAPVGLFTISQPAQSGGRWIALGSWHEGVEPPKKEEKAADLSKPKAPVEDDRPVLKRPSAQPKPETPPPTETKKENPPAQPPQAQAPKPAAAAAPPTDSNERDPNRPILRRGKPEQTPEAPSLPELGTKAKPGTANEPKRVLVAISDAKHNEYQSFAFSWKPEEQKKLTQQMTDLAAAELRGYAKQHPGAFPAQLQDVQVRAFDLDLSNEPELVLMAQAAQGTPPPPARTRGRTAPAAPAQAIPLSTDFYVTIVARQDFNGELHRLYSAVTDSRHLDVYPRMDLIDVVDADGNGRGELLFRQITDQGRAFVIYRVGADQLSEIYDSSAPMD